MTSSTSSQNKQLLRGNSPVPGCIAKRPDNYLHLRLHALWTLLLAGLVALPSAAQSLTHGLNIHINSSNGSYSVSSPDLSTPTLTATVAANINGQWVTSSAYPHHQVQTAQVQDDLGAARQWTVTFSGLAGEPDLIYVLRAYPNRPYADIQVTVHNTTGKTITVEDIRPVAASGAQTLNLGATPGQDRVLSDSFSEDRPPISIHNLGDASMQRGVGSQLLYNRQTHESFFAGVLSSNRFLTLLQLHEQGQGAQAQITAYNVDCTGTTALEIDNSLQHSRAADRVTLRLSVAPGAELPSERLLLSVSKNYHAQLETYGSLIRQLHHARVSAPSPMGWWSWTAYYFGLNSGTALTNAEWETQHLKSLGYDFFHIDEGYDYARGEYTTADATLFPHGMNSLEKKITGLGLVPGIWTAPFEVSERSWVYEHHKDWLVHNAAGQPIHLGWVSYPDDRLYALDCTNPGAQKYLYQTYWTMAHVWGIRYIKLDFMDDSAIEGDYYKPNTTAMEAQRIGLGIIRKAVGNGVYLDKDGSVMLNPVGYVDFGRISVDTGHAFTASKQAEPGIAARFYMNRNFFVADPDAFSVSEQRVAGQTWHNSRHPLTLSDAQVAISLAAVAGGMFEIGDDLPTLGTEPQRLALVENKTLINMIRLGHSSIPVDLMSYSDADQQPSIFILHEDPRQSILTVFNWTDQPQTHTLELSSLGLSGSRTYNATNVLDSTQPAQTLSGSITFTEPPHSVRMFKIIDPSVAAQLPVVHIAHPDQADDGATVEFSAQDETGGSPVVTWRWDMGDGITLTGPIVHHAYTRSGTYTVKLTATGLDGLSRQTSFPINITGYIPTKFVPSEIKRYTGTR